MDITRFDEIPNLVAYWSAVESTINKTGDNVDDIDSAYNNDPVHPDTTLTGLGTPQPTHNPATILVDQCPAFYFPPNADTRLHRDLGSGNELASGPYTVCCLYQLDDTGDGEEIYELKHKNSNNFMSQYRNGTSHNFRINNLVRPTGITRTTAPETSILLWDSVVGTASGYIDGIEGSPFATTTNANGWRHTYIGNSTDGGLDSGGVKIAKLAVYNKLLTTQEIAAVHTLLMYWSANGEAPSTGPEPSNQTTSIDYKHPYATLLWEHQPSGGEWQDATNLSGYVSGQGTDTLELSGATEAEAGYLRCAVSNPAGAIRYSDTCRLTATASAPQITEGITNQTPYEGESAVYGPITVTGSPTPTLLWEAETADGNNTWADADTVFGADGSGQGTDTYTIANTVPADNRDVRVTATNTGGSDVSQAALTVTPKLEFVSAEPTDKTVSTTLAFVSEEPTDKTITATGGA